MDLASPTTRICSNNYLQLSAVLRCLKSIDSQFPYVHTHKILRSGICAQVEVDGRPLELPEDIEGVLLLNIASYMGGVNLWASGAASTAAATLDAPQSFCDGVLEVRTGATVSGAGKGIMKEKATCPTLAHNPHFCDAKCACRAWCGAC